jgi:hypothetical protein
VVAEDFGDALGGDGAVAEGRVRRGWGEVEAKGRVVLAGVDLEVGRMEGGGGESTRGVGEKARVGGGGEKDRSA